MSEPERELHGAPWVLLVCALWVLLVATCGDARAQDVARIVWFQPGLELDQVEEWAFEFSIDRSAWVSIDAASAADPCDGCLEALVLPPRSAGWVRARAIDRVGFSSTWSAPVPLPEPLLAELVGWGAVALALYAWGVRR